MVINTLSCDIETFSDVDLKSCGVYRYAESTAFDILLFGYSVNGGPVEVVDLALGEQIPDDILKALTDNSVLKTAYNASFERVCLSYWLRKNHPAYFKGYGKEDDPCHLYLDPAGWKCSLVLSAYNGLPLSLEGVGAVLQLEQQKMTEGKRLIKYFCVPCLPTKANGFRTLNKPYDDLDKWSLFKAYNKRDVETEMAISQRLAKYEPPQFIWDQYHLDQQINDRGILVDMDFVRSAIALNERSSEELSARMQELTSLDNPNSVMQLKTWLAENGVVTEKLGKKDVVALLKDCPGEIAEVLKLRQQLSRASIKKYEAMQNCVCRDDRARGCFFFYGANRSGRWAGRHIQLQNLPQNHIEDLDGARALVKAQDYESLKAKFNDVPDVLSQLIRTAFIAPAGYKYIVADYCQIEARVLSFLSKEDWRLEVFEANGDIYSESASNMFHVKVEKNGVNGHLRQKGKISELALGYGGSTGALKAMGALDMGISEEELQVLVDRWRGANPNIVSFWWAVDDAVKKAVNTHLDQEVNGLRFRWRHGMLFVELPSGRHLSYVKPKLAVNDLCRNCITYEGTTDTSKHWGRVESYGPKFVENITQAISRDVLAEAMIRLSGCRIVGHVHDEVIIEVPENGSVEEICAIMGKSPTWLDGICLKADGYETFFYKKE